MIDIESQAKELRQQIEEKKKSEPEDQAKQRMKKVLGDRDAAMKTIYDYQDKTGIPTKEEAEANFFNVEAKQD
jgi:hypothetical protein